MSIIGMGNALVDALVKINDDDILIKAGLKKGVMEMISLEQMLSLRQTIDENKRTRQAGGSVCNSMRSIAMLGGTAGYIGKVGNDDDGLFYEQAIRNAGVQPFLIRTEGISGNCTVMISADGERTMSTFLGPAPTILPEEVKEDYLKNFQVIYIEGYMIVNEPLVCETMKKAHQLGLKVALDLSNFNIVKNFMPLLENIVPKYVDILFSNESEAEAFTSEKPEQAVKTLSSLVSMVACVTIGKDGVLVGSKGGVIHEPAASSNPVDTTGAGDNYAAGFLYGLSAGSSLSQAAQIGSLLSSEVIHVIGAQIPADRWKQIKLKVNRILA